MTTKSFLPGNLTDYIPVAVFIFTCGIVYNTIASLAIKNSELENRLEKKIIIIIMEIWQECRALKEAMRKN